MKNLVSRDVSFELLRSNAYETLTLTLSVILLRKASVQQSSLHMGKKGPRILAFRVMNRLYFSHKLSWANTSPKAPRSKHAFGLVITRTFSKWTGTKRAASDSPLKMKMKSARACKALSRKNLRLTKALSECA